MEKRLKFEKGKQREFILKACGGKTLLNFMAEKKIEIPLNTMKKYARESLTIPLTLAENIAKKTHQNISNYPAQIIEGNWGAKKGGKKGILALYKKYPKKIEDWRKKGHEGFVKKYAISKTLNKNIPLDEKLAEFMGVYLGDGTFTKYFIRVFGDKRYDRHYFDYLTELTKQIFGITPKIRTGRGNQLILEIVSKRFCDFLKKEFGLRYGSKIKNRQIIPKKILVKKSLVLACLRGLVDTDGSVSKDGATLCIKFCSHNPLLIEQIIRLNEELKLFTFHNKTLIGTRSVERIDNFFKEVGSSNLSRIIRYCEFKKNNLIRKEEVLKYTDEYKDVKIPYGPVV